MGSLLIGWRRIETKHQRSSAPRPLPIRWERVGRGVGSPAFSRVGCSYILGRAIQLRRAGPLQRVNDRGLCGVVGGGIGAAGDAYGAILRVVVGKIFLVFPPMMRRFRLVSEL